MAMQALKDERTKLKRAVTIQSKRVSRITAERDIIALRNEIDTYKETFSEFLKVHEHLAEQTEDGAAVDENDAYLDDVQESYIKVLQSANKVLDSVPNNPRHDDDLPKLEIDKFSGDPLEYQYFISVFKDSVEAKCKDPGKSLLRLLQYTKGSAKKAISHCAIMGGKKGLNEAKSILRERFGDS